MKKLILALTIVLYSFAVFAQGFTASGTPDEVFRPLSKILVQRVVDAGITRSGRLDLNRLLRELDTVNWGVQEYGFFGGSGGQRLTSIYLVEERLVIINLMSLQNMINKPVPMFAWALHEGLGALGYPDENYEISVAIEFMSKNISEIQTRQELVRPQLQDMGRRSTRNRHYESSGGTTVVGGGGDAPIIELKSLLLERLQRWAGEHRPAATARQIQNAMNHLLRFPIEFAGDQSYNSTEFKFEGNKLIIAEGMRYRYESLYSEEYMDSLLAALEPHLFP